MNKYRLFVWMIILAALAGVINAISVFRFAGATVSHVTGLITKLAISVTEGDVKDFFGLFAIIISFFVGAVVAGILTGERAFHLHKIYGYILISIGILVLIPLFIDSLHSVFLLAFLMGLQNGMVVSFKGVLVRLTHMTGNLTDFGVYIGYRIRGNKNERHITGLVPAATLSGFTLGCIIGILLYKLIGVYVFIAVSVIYILMGFAYFYLQKTCIDKNLNGIPDDEESA